MNESMIPAALAFGAIMGLIEVVKILVAPKAGISRDEMLREIDGIGDKINSGFNGMSSRIDRLCDTIELSIRQPK